jgi:predicted PurR-regulated permease PerM
LTAAGKPISRNIDGLIYFSPNEKAETTDIVMNEITNTPGKIPNAAGAPSNSDALKQKKPPLESSEPTGSIGAADAYPTPAEAIFRDRRSLNVNRYAIIGLLLLVTLAIFPIVKIFFVPVIVATTLVTLFFPMYQWILKLFGNRRGLSSFVCCLIISLCLIAPTYVVVQLVVKQAIELYQTAEPVIKDIIVKGSKSEFLLRIQALPLIHRLQFSSIDFSALLQEAIKTLATVGTKVFNKTSASLFELIIGIFVIFFTMFYFFMDGKALVKRIKYLSPIHDDYEEMIISRFLLISRATVMGTVIIGITQGSLGALVLLIFGIKAWLLWGFIMIILSIIPFAGAGTILIPAGIIQIIIGNVWQGIGIILISLFVVSTIDNLIRPRLVGQGAKLHDLVIFFSSLGGIMVFGAMGFIVGPVIAALFVAVLDIYSREFEQQLGSPENQSTAN